ncbi:MAG TPA: transcription elongation factor GreA [Candidatus Paceibacterota bacterium]
MNDEQEFLTRDKFEELTKELDFLKKTKRKEIAESLEYAKSLGDLSENAEYHEARETQANLENKIAKLEILLKTGAIVTNDEKTQISGIISVGSTITIEKTDNNEIKVFQIVGSEESDIGGGKISIHSPLGEGLNGKKKGDSIVVKTPKGNVSYKIIKVK